MLKYHKPNWFKLIIACFTNNSSPYALFSVSYTQINGQYLKMAINKIVFASVYYPKLSTFDYFDYFCYGFKSTNLIVA